MVLLFRAYDLSIGAKPPPPPPNPVSLPPPPVVSNSRSTNVRSGAASKEGASYIATRETGGAGDKGREAGHLHAIRDGLHSLERQRDLRRPVGNTDQADGVLRSGKPVRQPGGKYRLRQCERVEMMLDSRVLSLTPIESLSSPCRRRCCCQCRVSVSIFLCHGLFFVAV